VCEDIGHERGGTATGGTDTHHGSGAGDASERCTEYRYSAARYFSLICNCVCTHISRCDSSMWLFGSSTGRALVSGLCGGCGHDYVRFPGVGAPQAAARGSIQGIARSPRPGTCTLGMLRFTWCTRAAPD